MGAARSGLTVSQDHIWCSVLPTPRELVNLVGKGIANIYIGNISATKKSASAKAKETLESSDIMTFKEMHL